MLNRLEEHRSDAGGSFSRRGGLLGAAGKTPDTLREVLLAKGETQVGAVAQTRRRLLWPFGKPPPFMPHHAPGRFPQEGAGSQRKARRKAPEPHERCESNLRLLAGLQRYAPVLPGLLLLLVGQDWVARYGLWLVGGILASVALAGVTWLLGIRRWWALRTTPKNSRDALATSASQTPPQPSQPEPGLDRIRTVRSDWAQKARGRQRARRAWAVGSAALGPAAVLALAGQIVFFHHPEAWQAWALIGGEIFFIGVAAATVHLAWPAGRVHGDWVAMRLRAEILQREEHLYRTRLGAYLNRTDPEIVDRRLRPVYRFEPPLTYRWDPRWWRVFSSARNFRHRLRRRRLREQAIVLRLLKMMEMGHRDRGERHYWRHNLEDNYSQNSHQAGNSGSGPPATDWQQTAETYISERLEHQQRYYARAAEKHALMDEGWESMTVSILGFAGVLGLLHWKLLGLGHEPGTTEKLVELVALALPPVGAAFAAMRTAFENHHLAQSYREMVRQLGNLVGELKERMEGDTLDAHAFQRLVIRAETLLSQEISRWAVIVTPARPKGGP